MIICRLCIQFGLESGENVSEVLSHSCVALSELSPGEAGTLHHSNLNGILRLRLMDLGFTHGALVDVVRKGPGGRLLAVRVRGTVMAIRHKDAVRLLVSRLR